MSEQMEQYQDAARRLGWTAAWKEMLRFVTPLIDGAGPYDDTRHAILMRDLCTSQLFMSGDPAGVAPQVLSSEINTTPPSEPTDTR